jgi:hypothetical protein
MLRALPIAEYIVVDLGIEHFLTSPYEAGLFRVFKRDIASGERFAQLGNLL